MSSLSAIILCRTQQPGNIGSVTRVMANFGFTQLILVDPPTGWRQDHNLLNMSNGYIDKLEHIQVVDSLEELSGQFGGLIGFTRRAGATRPVLGELEDAVAQIVETKQPERFGLVFGNERTGLSKEELSHCDSLYTIATTKEHGSLNLAMATGVVMYQLAREAKSIQPYADGTDIKPEPIISTDEVNQRTNELLDTISQTGIFENGKDQRSHAEVYLRKILMRARLTGFESRWLQRMAMRLQVSLREESK
jgi:TrmH family RNA methyltransferase